jgi:hypothetical protein
MCSDNQFKFTYNEKETHDSNYACWRLLNNEERFRFGLTEYTEEEAKEKFNQYFPQEAMGSKQPTR